MKKVAVIFAMLFLAQVAMAKEFKFVFNYPYGATKPAETLVVKNNFDSWESAYKDASSKCAKFFADKSTLSEEKILDIIDVCANPR